MNDWFTVEKINNSTYSISEHGHWEQTHSYLFIGTEKAVLIDSGLGVGNIKKVIDKITALPVLVIISHAHWDHTGGCKYFVDIAVHKNDKNWIEHGLPIPVAMIRANFNKEPLTKTLPKDFDPNAFTPFVGKITVTLNGGETINLGGRKLQIIHTPGHSPGHISVYEEETGLLTTGDLLYEGVLDAFYESTNPVLFAESISKLASLQNITKLLPGHFKLNIPISYLDEARKAFDELKKRGLLKQGTGIHKFKHFSIHL